MTVYFKGFNCVLSNIKIYTVGENVNSWGEFTASVEFIGIVGSMGRDIYSSYCLNNFHYETFSGLQLCQT